jgi:Domain of unknown function (DUF4126)
MQQGGDCHVRSKNDPMVILLSLFLGTTLAAVAGLRAFMPLFLIGVLERAELLAPFSLGDNFQWLTTDVAILTFGIATVLEIAADKIPGMDSGLDAFMTFVRPGAGAVSVFAILSSQDPTLAYVAGFVLAGGATLPIHFGKGLLRLGSHATTAGFGSPVLSVAEDTASAGAIALSVLIPLFALIFGLLSMFLIGRIVIKIRRRRAAT